MNYKELQQTIEPNKYYTFRNFTGRYLLPQIKLLEQEFLENLDQSVVLAFGLCDRNYEHYTEFDNKLFILLSMKGNINYWMNNYEYYLYQDGEADKIMVIIDLPIDNRSDFLQGNYSKLYSPEDRDKLISKYIYESGVKSISSAWGVITKSKQTREMFENKVNKDFNLNPKITIDSTQEYEYPPVLSREIFNYG